MKLIASASLWSLLVAAEGVSAFLIPHSSVGTTRLCYDVQAAGGGLPPSSRLLKKKNPSFLTASGGLSEDLKERLEMGASYGISGSGTSSSSSLPRPPPSAEDVQDEVVFQEDPDVAAYLQQDAEVLVLCEEVQRHIQELEAELIRREQHEEFIQATAAQEQREYEARREMMKLRFEMQAKKKLLSQSVVDEEQGEDHAQGLYIVRRQMMAHRFELEQQAVKEEEKVRMIQEDELDQYMARHKLMQARFAMEKRELKRQQEEQERILLQEKQQQVQVQRHLMEFRFKMEAREASQLVQELIQKYEHAEYMTRRQMMVERLDREQRDFQMQQQLQEQIRLAQEQDKHNVMVRQEMMKRRFDAEQRERQLLQQEQLRLAQEVMARELEAQRIREEEEMIRRAKEAEQKRILMVQQQIAMQLEKERLEAEERERNLNKNRWKFFPVPEEETVDP